MATTIEDLEDGEIEDSDTEAGPTLINNTVLKDDDKFIKDAQYQAPQPQNTAYRSTKTQDLDSSAESGSEDDDFLDLMSSPIKYKQRKTDNISISKQEIDNESYDNQDKKEDFSQAAKKYQQNKPHSVWNKIVIENTLNDTIFQASTVEKDENDQRGVESYDFKTLRRKQVSYDDDFFDGDGDFDNEGECVQKPTSTGNVEPEKDNHAVNVEMEDESEQPEEQYHLSHFEDAGDIGDVESFGTAAKLQPKPSRKRKIQDRLGKRPDPDENSRSRSASPHAGPGRDHRKHVKARLGHVRFPQGPVRKPTFNLNSTNDDPNEKVSLDLVQALGEPEYQTELFFRVVTTVGVKKSLEIYYQTECIEESGGMMVLNGHRRRSPGGVFLQLLKTDSETTKEHVNLMFPKDATCSKRRRKKHKHDKRKEHSANVEDEKQSPEKDEMDLAELPMKKEVLLESKSNDKDFSMDLDKKDNEGHGDDLDLGNDVHDINLEFPFADADVALDL